MSALGVLLIPFIKDPVSRAPGESLTSGGHLSCAVIVQSSLCSASPLSSEKFSHSPKIRPPRISKLTIFNNFIEICFLYHEIHPFLI